jgi:hypothetical protein
MRRNLVLTLGAIYDGDVYQGIAQSDDRFGITASARWKLNRNFSASVAIDATTRSSTLLLDQFDRNQVTFGVQGRF